MVHIDGRVSPRVARLWTRLYPGFDPLRFNALVESTVSPSDRVLEIGAGSGQGSQNRFALKGRVAEYIGIDPDPRVLQNPSLDRGVVCTAESLPFDDEHFDLVFHTMVAEHLPDPIAAMCETARVLKPGGRVLFETPSRYYYPMLAAALTPQWFHEWYVAKLGSGRSSEDVFPTVYRANDSRTIRSVMTQAGLVPVINFWSTPPGYLRFSPLSFLVGVLYERTAERLVPALRARIVVTATKPQ
jgi:ubiquinone/menaquinone biosynthesis C-methylase UbiE